MLHFTPSCRVIQVGFLFLICHLFYIMCTLCVNFIPIIIRGLPTVKTSISQKFIFLLINGNCTMTYLKRSPPLQALVHWTVTVAPSDTVPGYWPHRVQFHRTGARKAGSVLVRPTMKLLDLYPKEPTGLATLIKTRHTYKD